MTEPLRLGLGIGAVGILIVFAVLTLIALLVVLIGKLDARWQDEERRREEASLERTPTIDTTTAVVIAAAAATYVGGRVRVRAVRRLLSPDLEKSPWSVQGRATLQGSHVVSRREGIER
jgi:Na+-transporting methylmalonyl-CoA/oxaloacetate decarboxylase gamma subunit